MRVMGRGAVRFLSPISFSDVKFRLDLNRFEELNQESQGKF